MIDDSALLHARSSYDPVKAREYYLRTRKLKGRRKGGSDDSIGRRPAGSSPPGKKTSNRAALVAEREALENRLERLKEVLREAVEAAKRRSGVEPTEAKTKKSSDKETKEKPKTAAEKRKEAKEAKERYEKEKKPGLPQELEALRDKIADIRDQIKEALEDARRKSRPRSTFETAPRAVDSKQEGDRQNGRR